MEPLYYVRVADLKQDKEEILSIWKENGVNTRDPIDHFAWAYEQNPFGKGRIWLLVHGPTAKVIGCIGLILRRMKVGDSIHLVGRASGFAVNKSFRSLGPSLMLGKAMLNEVGQSDLSILYTMAPPGASLIFNRLKFQKIETLGCRWKIFSFSDAINKRLPALPLFLRTGISRAIDYGFQCLSRETWRRCDDAKLMRITEFDKRFDELWDRAAPVHKFASERSSEFLNWRFNNELQRKFNFICMGLITYGGTLCGYVIYYINNKTAHIVDFFTEDMDTTPILLSTVFLRHLRRENISYATINIVCSESHYLFLKKMGFSRWRAPSPLPYDLYMVTGNNCISDYRKNIIDQGFYMADDFLDYL